MDHYRGAEGGRYEGSSRRSYGHWPDSHKGPLSPSGTRRDRYDYEAYDPNRKGPIPDYYGTAIPGYHTSPSALDPLKTTVAAADADPSAHTSHARPTAPATPAMQRVDDLYERVGQVGEGTYGKVYKARNKQTGEFVALKRIRMEAEKDGFPITAMREIKLLRTLNHRHVVSLRELMVSKGAVYMVLEYMDHDLTGILGHPHLRFRPEHIKCLLRQLFEGLAFLHHKGVLHRDMKGSNLLVNRHGELKLTDFGLARLFQKKAKRDYTNRVITLWYRPPELLLGATAYGPEVDMWSAGCIMVELFTRKPIFTGQNEISQLDNIWRVMGTPQVETWPELTELQWFDLLNPLKGEARPPKFREMYSKVMSPAAMDLAEALLCLNPKKRPSAAEALKFPYFTEELPPACLPEELPKIEGDWHEYESKQRKKNNAKTKQQTATQPVKKDAEKSDFAETNQTLEATVSKTEKASVSEPASVSTPRPPPDNQAPVDRVEMSGVSGTEAAPQSAPPPPPAAAPPNALEHEREPVPQQQTSQIQSSSKAETGEAPIATIVTNLTATTTTLPPTHPLSAPKMAASTTQLPQPVPPTTTDQRDIPSSESVTEKEPPTSQQQPPDGRPGSTTVAAPVVTVPTAGYNGITYEIPAYAFLGGERSAPVTARDRYYDRSSSRRDYSRDRDRDRDYGDYRSGRSGRDRYYEYDREYERGSSSSRHRDWSRERYRERERDRDYYRERDRRSRDYHRDRDRDRDYYRSDRERERDRDRSAREREYEWYREEYYHKSAGGHGHPPTGPASATAAISTGPGADSETAPPASSGDVAVGESNPAADVPAIQGSTAGLKAADDAAPTADSNEPALLDSSVSHKQEKSLEPDDDYYRHPSRPRSPFDYERGRYGREYDRIHGYDRARDYDISR
ncbi:kinase subunit of RNA polymerase II carboxy-terminal domain kinase I, partial [Actinomortierella wolfii]